MPRYSPTTSPRAGDLRHRSVVMPGQKREARLRARCPGHPRPTRCRNKKGVDGRDKPGHDEKARKKLPAFRSNSLRAFALLSRPDSPHIPAMAKHPGTPKKPVKTPKSKAPSSKASRPDVQPIGPALAELLNPAINRGEAGVGSTTGTRGSEKKVPPSPALPHKGGGRKTPACSRRRIIPGIAAPVAKPPPIARGPRRGERAMMWRSGMRRLPSATAWIAFFQPTLPASGRGLFLPSLRAQRARGGEGRKSGVGVARHSLTGSGFLR